MSKFKNTFLVACITSIGTVSAHSVPMTAQIQSLLNEKQQKIEALEKCEGKKQGWMIAGISTIGLTAVGVVGNIALANKSKSIDSTISNEKFALNTARQELENINAKIAEHDEDKISKVESKSKQTILESIHNDRYIGDIEEKTNKDNIILNTEINGTGYCFRSVRDYGYRGDITIDKCRTLDYSDWIVQFPDGNIVHGISLISSNMPSNRTKGVIPDAKNQVTLMNEYDDWRNNGRPLPIQTAEYACYCKMTEPYIGYWVFESWASGYALTDNCSFSCAWAIEDIENFRKIMFNK